MKNVFIRGSVVRYVHLPGSAVDTALLEDATRRGKHPRLDPESAYVAISGWGLRGLMRSVWGFFQKRRNKRRKRGRHRAGHQMLDVGCWALCVGRAIAREGSDMREVERV